MGKYRQKKTVDWWKPVLLGCILTCILGLVGYGFTERAIIVYWLEAPDSSDLQFKFYEEVRIIFENRGNTDAIINITISVKNATIRNGSVDAPHRLVSESIAEFYFAVGKNQKGYQVIHIVPKDQTENFIVEVNVKKMMGSTISEFLNYIFGEVVGRYPTSVIYKRVNGKRYQKVK